MSRKSQGQTNSQVVVNVEIHRHGGGIESAYGDEYSYGPVQKSNVFLNFLFFIFMFVVVILQAPISMRVYG